jgi:hypothetical protein
MTWNKCPPSSVSVSLATLAAVRRRDSWPKEENDGIDRDGTGCTLRIVIFVVKAPQPVGIVAAGFSRS